MKKILLLDEKITRRDQLASRLRMQGFKVELSDGGFHTIHLVEREIFDSCIIFGNMMDMHAIEIMALVRCVRNKEELQIIFCSATKSPDVILASVEAGASEFLVYTDKSFQALLNKIEGFKRIKQQQRKNGGLIDSDQDQ